MRFAREAFSNFKTLLRAAAAREVRDLLDTIRITTGAFTQTECRNYFSAVRYNANVSENA
jgi:hypothetical protein